LQSQTAEQLELFLAQLSECPLYILLNQRTQNDQENITGLGTDTQSKSYIRIMERDVCSFKLCPETNLMLLRTTSRRRWGSGGAEAAVKPLSSGSVRQS